MNFKLQLLLYSFIGLFVYLYIPVAAGAAGCEPIYGGGPTCTDTTLTIQKQVLNPSTNHFIHNLGLSDPKYHIGDLVTFQITLTNNGNATIQNIVVKDTLPQVLTFADGPGQFNTTNSILTFTVNNLVAHHSQLFTISGRVASEDQFPRQNTFCTTNIVSALPSSGTIVQDSSQFCLQKLTSTPATGPEAFEFFSLLPIGLAGFVIKRFKHNQNSI